MDLMALSILVLFTPCFNGIRVSHLLHQLADGLLVRIFSVKVFLRPAWTNHLKVFADLIHELRVGISHLNILGLLL